MPAKPETKLQQKIRKALVEHGGLDLYIFKMHGGPHSPPGVPDLIMCYRGVFVGLEVKMPHRASKVTEVQAHHLNQIRRAGGYSRVVTAADEAVAILMKIDDQIGGRHGPSREEAA
jgi:hypothetical protein